MISINTLKEKYGAEQALVVLMCRLYFRTAGRDDVLLFINNNGVDYNLFYELISQHEIRPLIYEVISKSDITLGNITDKLRAAVIRISAANMDRFRELLVILPLLRKNGIEAVAVKGVVLSRLLYGNVIGRETCDIDIFIRASDLGAARQILLGVGYEDRSYYRDDLLAHIVKTEREHKLYNPRNGIYVELQWQVTLNVTDTPVSSGMLLECTQRFGEKDKQVETPNLQSHLLLLMAHHGVNDLWRTLKHVVDIGVFVDKYGNHINVQAFMDATVQYRIHKSSLTGFKLVEEIFGIRKFILPDNIVTPVQEVTDNLLSYPLIERVRPFLQNIWQQLILRDSARDKIRVIWRYLLKLSHPDVKQIEALNLPTKYFFMHYLYRPIHLTLKAIRMVTK